jgi:hypothetical protein
MKSLFYLNNDIYQDHTEFSPPQATNFVTFIGAQGVGTELPNPAL